MNRRVDLQQYRHAGTLKEQKKGRDGEKSSRIGVHVLRLLYTTFLKLVSPCR